MGSDRLDRGEDWVHGADVYNWVAQAERDQGRRAGSTSEERERIKALERENRELRQANEMLPKASAYFAQAKLDPPGSGHDRLHRRLSRGLRGRADLSCVEDRPVQLSRARRAAASP